jgi:hypothetical protein
MISGTRDRRRRQLAWSVFISIILNVAILTTALHYAPIIWGTKRGATETVHSAQFMSLDKKPISTPQPPSLQPPVPQAVVQPQPKVKPVAVQVPPAAAPPRIELSREDKQAPPQPSAPPKPTTLQSRIDSDSHNFANTVAKLNAQNGVKAIPTIDPATEGGSNKSYGFRAPNGRGSENEGYGLITTTRMWRDRGADCYYGRYELTNPDGSEESGDIVWPFCYDPGADPFKERQHDIPFPFPLAGFRLPPGTALPPYEKTIYDMWLRQQ